MNYSSKYLIKLLKKNGFVFSRSNGSHHLYINPVSGKRTTVPVHGKKDLPKGTFYAILKQSGIEEEGYHR
ncbi:MAG: type II toxin-antitoxin system HicA family toxin [Bacteroidota bacterium]